MAGKLTGIGSCLSGLPVGDPCYDPEAYSWWNSDNECACMAAHPDLYPFGKQCVDWSPSGVAQAFTYPIGQAAKGLVTGAVKGGTPDPNDYSSYIGYGLVALVAVVVLGKVL